MNKFFYTLIILLSISCAEKKPIVNVHCSALNVVDSMKLKGAFTILNKGTGDLVIEDFEIGCDCTTFKLKKGLHIKPSDSLIVPIEIKTNTKIIGRAKEVYISIKTNAIPRFTSFSFSYLK